MIPNRSMLRKAGAALFALQLVFTACSNKQNPTDASGTFEADEVIVSSEASGVIREFKLEEGQEMGIGQYVGYIDSTQLYLRKKQLQAQINAVLSKRPDITSQLAALEVQLEHAVKEQQRVAELLKGDAATKKQFDDAKAQVDMIRKQIAAQQSALEITSAGLTEETMPLKVQAEQLDDQLNKCRIINQVKGSVLTRYVLKGEMATTGKPLYKIADLSFVFLRAYITGNQLTSVKPGQQVKVFTDDGKGAYREYSGVITWISSEAEFTPKTIQTKDERANLVYAIKIKVKNDGLLKTGMYGEVRF